MIWPADVTLTSRRQPDAKSCSATSAAKGAPTAPPMMPISPMSWRSKEKRDTRDHVRLESAAHAEQAAPISFREVFALTSFRDRNLFASFGLGVERIGILKAIYPATWGHPADCHRP